MRVVTEYDGMRQLVPGKRGTQPLDLTYSDCEVINMMNPMGPPLAAAKIRGDREHPCLRGMVRFYQMRGSVLITAEISGLPRSGFFAFHIHEGASCGGEGVPNSAGHYNPTNAQHPDHAGDLPPLLSASGNAYLAVKTDRFSIREIIGRTVIIHSDPDDFHTQPSGNSGKKIGCGEIYSVCRR